MIHHAIPRVFAVALATFVGCLLLSCLFLSAAPPQDAKPGSKRASVVRPQKPISSRVVRSESGERTLVEEVWIEAPLAMVWSAYTTAEGWTAWASPAAEIKLATGGTIRTNYEKGRKVGEAGTNTLHIESLVPERMLILRAELQKNWPEVMKKDASKLRNVIVFDAFGSRLTRLRSFGCGYGAAPEYEKLMRFFIRANLGLYRKLIAYLEKGERAFEAR